MLYISWQQFVGVSEGFLNNDISQNMLHKQQWIQQQRLWTGDMVSCGGHGNCCVRWICLRMGYLNFHGKFIGEIWGVNWTVILHFPITVNWITDIGKPFPDIGKSFYSLISINHFPISEIRFSDIANWNIWNHFDFQLDFRYRKIELPISVSPVEFPILANMVINRHRKIIFWYREINLIYLYWKISWCTVIENLNYWYR